MRRCQRLQLDDYLGLMGLPSMFGMKDWGLLEIEYDYGHEVLIYEAQNNFNHTMHILRLNEG